MTPLNPRNLLVVTAMTLACLGAVQMGQAQTLDTTPYWDGSSVIQYFGPTSGNDTPTFGETFIAPSGTTVLNNFTFYVGSSDGSAFDGNGNYVPDVTGDQYNVEGQVFNWTGSLFGGNSPQGTTGPALYTSPVFTITSDSAYEAVTVTIPGGLDLTAGDDYVIDLTDTDVTLPNNDFGIFELVFSNGLPGDGGGGFNYSNGKANGPWDDGADYGDLVFQANFSTPGSNGGGGSVPDGASTAGLFGVVLTGLALRPRRRRAVTQS